MKRYTSVMVLCSHPSVALFASASLICSHSSHQGDRDNAAMLVEYGFALPNNPYDLHTFPPAEVLRGLPIDLSNCSITKHGDQVSKQRTRILIAHGTRSVRDLSRNDHTFLSLSLFFGKHSPPPSVVLASPTPLR